MPEIGTSGSMSGDGKRGVGHRPQATAPILDSTIAETPAGGRRLSYGPQAAVPAHIIKGQVELGSYSTKNAISPLNQRGRSRMRRRIVNGASLLRWRSGSLKYPRDTPLHPFTPFPTFAHSSNFHPDSGSGLCPLLLFHRGFEPCEDART